ncbi:MAG: hypothetical protein HOE90_18150 [Bacteriovoracaceae bacterium]|jgi:hypothetical protein|nr:hypothetical protein [Bacteriovoracaceae bacterium]
MMRRSYEFGTKAYTNENVRMTKVFEAYHGEIQKARKDFFEKGKGQYLISLIDSGLKKAEYAQGQALVDKFMDSLYFKWKTVENNLAYHKVMLEIAQIQKDYINEWVWESVTKESL